MQRLPLGTIDISQAAREALAASGASLDDYLVRHRQGDWGEADEEDRGWSDWGVEYGHEVMSVYRLLDGILLFIITAGDRSITRVLLEEELQTLEVGAREGYDIWASSYRRRLKPRPFMGRG